MIPLIDVTPLQDGNRFRGIGSYVRGLLAGLEEIGVPHRRLGSAGDAPVPIDRTVRERRTLLRRTERSVEPASDELVHLTSQAAADTHVDGPFLATVHDPIPLLFPDLYLSGRGGRRRRRRFDRYLERLDEAAHLVAVSHATADAFADILGRDRDDFSVTPLAPARLPTPSGWRWRDGAAYVYVAANHEPHKNLRFALEAVGALPRDLRPPVVTTGVRDPGPWEGLVEAARELDVELHHEGHVDEQRLADLYAGARAVLMPSLFEGFGLPTLEAMACGTPVAVSDRGALPEVVGDAGTVLPLEVAQWADHLRELLTGQRPADREGLRAHAAGFTWRRTAEATVTAYEKVR